MVIDRWAKAQGFAKVFTRDGIDIIEIGDGASDAKDAMICAGRQRQFVGGADEECARVRIKARDWCEQTCGCRRVGESGIVV